MDLFRIDNACRFGQGYHSSLQWLEGFNKSEEINNKNIVPFTFDFDSLYDRLDPDVVISALRDAIQSCRDDWPTEFMDWLIDLANLSIEASVAEYQNKFYVSRKACLLVVVSLSNLPI